MSDYNKVQIGTVYLTDTGMVGGMPCRTEVGGLDELKPTTGGVTVLARDRTPKRFVHSNNRKGVVISIKAFAVNGPTINSILAFHNTSDTNGTAINVKITEGALGDFDLQCLVGGIQDGKGMSTAGEFNDTTVYDVTFVYVVASVNSIT